MAILWLNQVGVVDRLRVGRKASVLGELTRQGFPVPPGFCLTSDITPEHLDKIWPELWNAYCCLAGENGVVAVRSSGVAEDSPESSYAGQYESILNVQDASSLRAALHQCWESQSSPRLAVYRPKNGDGETGLAILVQKQVQARLSGVLFTRHPVTGDGSHTWMEVTQGLGNDLMNGRVSPVQVQVDRQGNVYSPSGIALLTHAEAIQLAELGKSTEALLGAGQDIEWAIEGEQVFVLQARPVTGLSRKLPLNHLWTRANVGEVLPGVTTPLTWSVFQHMLSRRQDEQAMAGSGSGTSSKADHENVQSIVPGARWINGRVYIRLDALLDSFCYLPFVTPGVLEKVLGVMLPSQAEPYSPPSGLLVQAAQTLFRMDASGLIPRLSWLLKRLPPVEELEGRQEDDLLSWIVECFGLHLKASAYAIGAFAWIEQLASPEPGPWLAIHQPTGRSMQSSEQGRILWDLAEKLHLSQDLSCLLTQSQDWEGFRRSVLQVPGGVDFLQAFQAFLNENGARAAGEFELAVPRWNEDPNYLLTVLRSYIEQLEREDKQAMPAPGMQLSHLDWVASKMGALEKLSFRRLSTSFARYTSMRENLKYQLMQGFAVLRRKFLQAGPQFVEKGILETAEDIFYLHLGEIQSLRHAVDLQPSANARVLQRKKQAQEWETSSTPELIFDDTALARDDFYPASRTRLAGIGCSPGVVTGYAHVLHGLSEISDLQPGEILVTAHTDPGWTPLFLSCKAVVTELGGFLSHGATVAREYGIPFVANVPGATTHIHTGDLISVNGSLGTIDLPGPYGEAYGINQRILES